MILRSKYGHNVEVRAVAEWGNTDPLRFRLLNSISPAGVAVTAERALGLPAVLECIRMSSQIIASLPPVVYRKRDVTDRTPQYGAWQYQLLTDMPNDPDNNRFNLISDVSACVEGHGNAFVQKVRVRKLPGQIAKLLIINPDRVRVYVEDGLKKFDIVQTNRAVVKGLTTNDILHVRGFTVNGLASGLSPIGWFRTALGNTLALQEYTGRYFANDATPAGYISVDARLDPAQAREILAIWEEDHGGLANRGRPGILVGGAKWNPVSLNTDDATFVAGQQFNVEEVARMMDWPAELLISGRGGLIKTEELALRVLQFYVVPRLERIKAVFNADPDLFALDEGLMMDFDIAQMLRADLIAQSTHDLRMRQAGILTANEIRATKGYPPLDGGDVLLPVPVGAAANQSEIATEGIQEDVPGEPPSSSPTAEES